MAQHPLHLLDDFLSSLAADAAAVEPSDQNDVSPQNESAEDVATMRAEARQDLVLRVADDLFANSATLLENALALLDEHEQSQAKRGSEIC